MIVDIYIPLLSDSANRNPPYASVELNDDSIIAIQVNEPDRLIKFDRQEFLKAIDVLNTAAAD